MAFTLAAVTNTLFQVVTRIESLGERNAVFVDVNLRETNPPVTRNPLVFTLSGLTSDEAITYLTGTIVKVDVQRPV